VKLPDDLRARIGGNVRPVRPLLAPWKRALLLVPAALLASAATPGVLGLRGDLLNVGSLLGWGGSIVQLCIAVALIAAALREAIPAESLPGTWARLLLLSGAVIAIGLALAINVVSPEPFGRTETFQDWFYCWRGAVVGGLPLLIVLIVLLARGLPSRPALAGALAGMGTGGAVDGGWRLSCNYSNPSHVIPSHVGAVLALTLLGVAAVILVTKIRK